MYRVAIVRQNVEWRQKDNETHCRPGGVVTLLAYRFLFLNLITGRLDNERSRCDCNWAVVGRGHGVSVGGDGVLACALPHEGEQVDRNQGQREPGSEPEQGNHGIGAAAGLGILHFVQIGGKV